VFVEYLRSVLERVYYYYYCYYLLILRDDVAYSLIYIARSECTVMLYVDCRWERQYTYTLIVTLRNSSDRMQWSPLIPLEVKQSRLPIDSACRLLM